MIRKALLIVCGVLLVATIALTAAGFIRPTVAEWRTASSTAWVSAKPGTLQAAFDPDSPYLSGGGIVLIDPGGGGWWSREWLIDAGVDPYGGGHLFVGAWLPLLVLAGAVWLLARPMIRARRRRPGSCVTCGYDLTGNTSGRCPECGTAATGTP